MQEGNFIILVAGEREKSFSLLHATNIFGLQGWAQTPWAIKEGQPYFLDKETKSIRHNGAGQEKNRRTSGKKAAKKADK